MHTNYNELDSIDTSNENFFVIFFQAKTILTDPKERDLYDSWRSSGIAMK